MPAALPRVFIVERDADSLEVLAAYVRALDHEVAGCAGTMQEALAALGGVEIDVLICSIGLPDGDGWRLLRLAGLPARVCCVAMSGSGRNADVLRSREAGYHHHLFKPLVSDALRHILEECAKSRTPCPR